MTDRELDRLIALAESGEITEAQADRLDRETIRRTKAMLSDPVKLAAATADPFVPAPDRGMMRGGMLFRAYCVRRGNSYKGQFDTRDDSRAAQRWAAANLPGYLGCRTRTLKNFTMTLGHLVYELKVDVKS